MIVGQQGCRLWQFRFYSVNWFKTHSDDCVLNTTEATKNGGRASFGLAENTAFEGIVHFLMWLMQLEIIGFLSGTSFLYKIIIALQGDGSQCILIGNKTKVD